MMMTTALAAWLLLLGAGAVIPCHGQSVNPPRAYRRDPVPDHAPRTQPFVHVTLAPSSTLNETLPATDPPAKPRNPPRKRVPGVRGPTKPPVVCPNNCDDQNPCTVDICSITEGGCLHTPKACPPNQSCDVFDNGSCKAKPPVVCPNNCDDQNPCTVDICSITEGGCLHTPKACPPNQSCDVFDNGNCKATDSVIPCVAVIDESDIYSNETMESLWNEFRAKYPSRPFCLLVPNSAYQMYLPRAFLAELGKMTTSALVSRDDGNATAASDWFNICNLAAITGSSTSIKYVGVFVDQSGSMDTGTVSASIALFEKKMEAAGLIMSVVLDYWENWIAPFMTTLVP